MRIGDRLRIQSLTRTVNVPITQVAAVYCAQKQEDGNTPGALLVLRASTDLGREIRFDQRACSLRASVFNSTGKVARRMTGGGPTPANARGLRPGAG
jgi:hypothetical protein